MTKLLTLDYLLYYLGHIRWFIWGFCNTFQSSGSGISQKISFPVPNYRSCGSGLGYSDHLLLECVATHRYDGRNGTSVQTM